MDVVSSAGIVVLVLVSLWWVLRPLWQGEESGERVMTVSGQQRLDELLHRRDAIYTAIKDLEFDLAADKVSQADYGQLRARLTREAAEVLKQIDYFSQMTDEALEAEIDTLLDQFRQEVPEDEALGEYVRNEIQESIKSSEQPRCPNCQHMIKSSDAFCSQCGTPLSHHCPQCQTSVMRDDLFCSQCGTQLVAEVVE